MLTSYPIYKIILEDRRDQALHTRMSGVEIRIGDSDAAVDGHSANPLCYHMTSVPTGPTVEFPCSQVLNGRYVLVRKITGGDWHVNEVRIFLSL